MATSYTNRTALFHRAQPGGIAVIDDFTEHPGNIFFVDSGQTTTGADAVGYGRNPDAPFLTLDYAESQATANQGDVIYLMPGHAETKAATGSLWALAVAGLNVIGLGKGADRPTFTLSHTGAATTITAASTRLENVVFVAGIDSVLAPLTISAADCSLIDVEFRDTTDIEFVVGVTTTAAADRIHIDGFQYRGYTGGNACTIGISLVGCNGGLVENSIFYGEFSTACVDLTDTLSTDITVRNCVFYNDNVALTKNVVDSATSSIWQVTDCFDGKGGYSFSGGSSATVASDDISALTALVGAIESTQTSDLHGKIGTDTQMGDKSLYDILVTGGPTTAPASAAPATTVGLYQVASAIYDDTAVIGAVESTQTSDIAGKIGTDTEMDNKSVFDLLVGDGPTTAPSSAAPGAAVSIYEVLSAVYDDTAIIGAIESTQTSDVTGKIGTDAEMSDRSLYDLLNGAGPTTAATGATAANNVSLYGALRYLEQTLVGAVASTQTSDLHGKIGTDAEMNDISLYDLLVGDGPSTAPSAATAGDSVSLYEVVRYIEQTLLGAVESTQTSDLHGKIGTDAEMDNISLYDLINGAGPSTAATGATAANDVSLYAVVRYIEQTLLGAVDSTQTSDLHGKIGTDAEMNDVSLYDLLVGIGPTTAPAGAAPANDVSLYEGVRYISETLRSSSGAYIPGYGYQVTKTEDLTTDPDNLFDVAGKVMITLLTGETPDAVPSACTLTLELAAGGNLCAATTIDNDGQFTMYVLTGDTGAVLSGGDVPVPLLAQMSGVPHTPIIVGEAGGTNIIRANLDAAEASGTIVWTLYYYPLEASAAVTAAA